MDLTSVFYRTDFINHWMTIIKSLNYAGFCSGGLYFYKSIVIVEEVFGVTVYSKTSMGENLHFEWEIVFAVKLSL